MLTAHTQHLPDHRADHRADVYDRSLLTRRSAAAKRYRGVERGKQRGLELESTSVPGHGFDHLGDAVADHGQTKAFFDQSYRQPAHQRYQ